MKQAIVGGVVGATVVALLAAGITAVVRPAAASDMPQSCKVIRQDSATFESRLNELVAGGQNIKAAWMDDRAYFWAVLCK